MAKRYKIYENVKYDEVNAIKIKSMAPNFLYCPGYTGTREFTSLYRARELACNGNINVIVCFNKNDVEFVEEYCDGTQINIGQNLVEKYLDMIENS